MKPKRYPRGPLTDPIVIDILGWTGKGVPTMATVHRKFRERVREEIHAKLDLLSKHYGISPNSSTRDNTLALTLAKAHVPGLQIIFKIGSRRYPGLDPLPRKPGAPRTRTTEQECELLKIIDGVRADLLERRTSRATAVTMKQAIIATLKRYPDKWKGRRGAKISARSLATRYYQAKKMNS